MREIEIYKLNWCLNRNSSPMSVSPRDKRLILMSHPDISDSTETQQSLI